MHELLQKHCKKIISDPIFLSLIQGHLDSITRDHRFSKSDIPSVVLLLLELTNNLDKLHLTKEQLQDSMPDILLYILKHFEVLGQNEKDYADIIRLCCSIALMVPKFKKYKCF